MHHLRRDRPFGGRQREARPAPGRFALGVDAFAVIDIDADEIGLLHLLPLAGGNGCGETLHRFGGRIVIAAENQAVQNDVEGKAPPAPVAAEVKRGPIGGLAVFGGILQRIAEPAAGHDADPGLGTGDSLDAAIGLAVCQGKNVEDLCQLFIIQLQARGMHAAAVAEDRDAGRLVDGHIAPDAAAKALCDELGIAAEGRDDVAVEPAAFVLQGAGQVPVIEGDHRFDAVFQKFVNQLVVKAQTGFVDFAVAVGDDPGPADREAVSLDAEFLHQGDVLAEAMVDIAGDIACVAVADMPGGIVAEVVPDARPFTVFIPGAFTLIGGAGDAPQKLFGKLFHGFSFGNTAAWRRCFFIHSGLSESDRSARGRPFRRQS